MGSVFDALSARRKSERLAFAFRSGEAARDHEIKRFKRLVTELEPVDCGGADFVTNTIWR